MNRCRTSTSSTLPAYEQEGGRHHPQLVASGYYHTVLLLPETSRLLGFGRAGCLGEDFLEEDFPLPVDLEASRVKSFRDAELERDGRGEEEEENASPPDRESQRPPPSSAAREEIEESSLNTSSFGMTGVSGYFGSTTKKVRSVVCSESSTAMVYENGKWRICGSLNAQWIAKVPKASLSRLRIAQIALGSNHVLFLEHFSRGVYALGANDRAQLGLGDLAARSLPALIPKSAFSVDSPVERHGEEEEEEQHAVDIVQIACGSYHSAALDSLGRVFTWGYGILGHGRGAGGTQMRPRRIERFLASSSTVLSPSSTPPIASIFCGESTTAFLTREGGELFMCGSGKWGKLGVGNEEDVHDPMRVSMGVGEEDEMRERVVVKVACGAYHTVALTATGRIFTWGSTANDRIPEICFAGARPSLATMPVEVPLSRIFPGMIAADVAVGLAHTVAAVVQLASSPSREGDFLSRTELETEEEEEEAARRLGERTSPFSSRRGLLVRFVSWGNPSKLGRKPLPNGRAIDMILLPLSDESSSSFSHEGGFDRQGSDDQMGEFSSPAEARRAVGTLSLGSALGSEGAPRNRRRAPVTFTQHVENAEAEVVNAPRPRLLPCLLAREPLLMDFEARSSVPRSVLDLAPLLAKYARHTRLVEENGARLKEYSARLARYWQALQEASLELTKVQEVRMRRAVEETMRRWRSGVKGESQHSSSSSPPGPSQGAELEPLFTLLYLNPGLLVSLSLHDPSPNFASFLGLAENLYIETLATHPASLPHLCHVFEAVLRRELWDHRRARDALPPGTSRPAFSPKFCLSTYLYQTLVEHRERGKESAWLGPSILDVLVRDDGLFESDWEPTRSSGAPNPTPHDQRRAISRQREMCDAFSRAAARAIYTMPHDIGMLTRTYYRVVRSYLEEEEEQKKEARVPRNRPENFDDVSSISARAVGVIVDFLLSYVFAPMVGTGGGDAFSERGPPRVRHQQKKHHHRRRLSDKFVANFRRALAASRVSGAEVNVHCRDRLIRAIRERLGVSSRALSSTSTPASASLASAQQAPQRDAEDAEMDDDEEDDDEEESPYVAVNALLDFPREARLFPTERSVCFAVFALAQIRARDPIKLCDELRDASAACESARASLRLCRGSFEEDEVVQFSMTERVVVRMQDVPARLMASYRNALHSLRKASRGELGEQDASSTEETDEEGDVGRLIFRLDHALAPVPVFAAAPQDCTPFTPLCKGRFSHISRLPATSKKAIPFGNRLSGMNGVLGEVEMLLAVLEGMGGGDNVDVEERTLVSEAGRRFGELGASVVRKACTPGESFFFASETLKLLLGRARWEQELRMRARAAHDLHTRLERTKAAFLDRTRALSRYAEILRHGYDDTQNRAVARDLSLAALTLRGGRESTARRERGDLQARFGLSVPIVFIGGEEPSLGIAGAVIERLRRFSITKNAENEEDGNPNVRTSPAPGRSRRLSITATIGLVSGATSKPPTPAAPNNPASSDTASVVGRGLRRKKGSAVDDPTSPTSSSRGLLSGCLPFGGKRG